MTSTASRWLQLHFLDPADIGSVCASFDVLDNVWCAVAENLCFSLLFSVVVQGGIIRYAPNPSISSLSRQELTPVIQTPCAFAEMKIKCCQASRFDILFVVSRAYFPSMSLKVATNGPTLLCFGILRSPSSSSSSVPQASSAPSPSSTRFSVESLAKTFLYWE